MSTNISSEWNIAANDIKYIKINPSATSNNNTEITTNQFYIINPTTGKKITLKYQGDSDYDFLLPTIPTTDNTTSTNVLVVNQNNNSISWEFADAFSNNGNISVNQCEIINPNNTKKVTLKYQGGNNYDFVLPANPPPTTDSSILVASPQNEITWQPATDLLYKPTIWVNSFESQPPAPTAGNVQRFPTTVIASWINPDQLKITISDKYLPIADRLFVSISYKQTSIDTTFTYVSKEYIIPSTQKLQDVISSVEITKPGGNNQWSNTIVDNKVTFNASQVSDEFSVTVAVYNSELSENKNTFIISNLYFANAGWPLEPIVTTSSVLADSTQYTLNFRANAIVAYDNDPATSDINITDIGAPKISRYTGKYYPTISTSQYRYGSIPTTELLFDKSGLLINDTTTETQQTLQNLYPDFTYRVETKSQNNISDILSDATITDFTTSALTYGDGYIDNKTPTPVSSSYINTVYYRESKDTDAVSISNIPIVYKQNVNWQISLNGGRSNYLGVHLAANRGSSSSNNIMKFSIEDKENISVYKELVYTEVPGFSNSLAAPTVTNTTDNGNNKVNVTLSIGTPIDYGDTIYKQGYYLILPIDSININVATKVWEQYEYKYAMQTLAFRQYFYTSPEIVKLQILNYYIADIDPNISPAIQTTEIEVDADTLANSSWYTMVSGVKVSSGKVKLDLKKLVVSNMGTYFYREGWLRYTFLNISSKAFDNNAFIINTDLSDPNNDFALAHTDRPSILSIDTGIDSGGNSYTSYAIDPILTISVNNITSNDLHNFAGKDTTIPIIVDYQSSIVVSYTDNVISRTTDNFKHGVHMKYPIDLSSEIALTTYTAFSYARDLYDHTIKIIDPAITPSDTQVLMLSNGLYCSPSYNENYSPYRDYTSYIGNQNGANYTNPPKDSNDYRYAVFRWSYPRDSNNISTLRVRISGLTSTSGDILPLKSNIVADTNSVVTQNNKEIQVYYRFEDNRSTTQNPAYINTSPQDASTPSISSIWINAHVLTDISFMNNIANKQKNLIHGGFKSVAFTNDTVTYTLTTPSFTPISYTSSATIGPYLYVIVGLPSDVDIAMSKVEVAL